eukprot:scaffold1467_cov147-Skeletonema_menzelii.AAC.16
MPSLLLVCVVDVGCGTKDYAKDESKLVKEVDRSGQRDELGQRSVVKRERERREARGGEKRCRVYPASYLDPPLITSFHSGSASSDLTINVSPLFRDIHSRSSNFRRL